MRSWKTATAGLSLIVGSLTSVYAQSSVADYVVPCTDDSIDFEVRLNFDDGSRRSSMCSRSYSRCPYPDGAPCLGNDNDWKTESNRSFDYLQTHAFAADNGSPSSVYVNDDTGQYACGRALYKDQWKDFELGASELDVRDWWGNREDSMYDPVQISIVPFNSDNDCFSGSYDFNAERTIAIWISAYPGQDSNPNDGSVYCDLSKNPDDW